MNGRTELTSVIVPAWRGGDAPPLAALVRALAATTTGPGELIVVCNGQDQALVNYLKGEPAVTRIAYLTENAGVARGWNIGAHLALGEYLVFANEDLVPGPGCIDALVEALRSNAQLGLVGPRGARWQFDAAGARHVEYVSGDGLVPCDAVSGFLFAMPRETLAAAGYFDDEFAPCSCEEIDMAQKVRRLGRSVCALGGLQYAHDWGVSAWDGQRTIAWLGQTEAAAAITLRNQARLSRKWGGGAGTQGARFDGRYYDAQYFARGNYIETMTRPRNVNGHLDPPLATTMAGVIEATGLLRPGGRVLDIASSYGFLVQELVQRGYDAYGIDFSDDAVNSSPVPERLIYGDVLRMATNSRYDLAFAGDIYEHLNDAEARILTQKIWTITDTLIAIINKSRHEPSHINIKSNREWLALFADCGLGLELAATIRGRGRYLRATAGTEAWHLNLLVLSKRAHTVGRRLLTRVFGDGTALWRLAGAARGLRR